MFNDKMSLGYNKDIEKHPLLRGNNPATTTSFSRISDDAASAAKQHGVSPQGRPVSWRSSSHPFLLVVSLSAVVDLDHIVSDRCVVHCGRGSRSSSVLPRTSKP